MEIMPVLSKKDEALLEAVLERVGESKDFHERIVATVTPRNHAGEPFWYLNHAGEWVSS